MSIEAIKWAQDLKIPPSPKFVLVTLATYAGDDGSCFPSFSSISKKTSFPRRSIIRHIEYLEKHNLLSRTPHPKYRSNIYQLNLSITEISLFENEDDSDTMSPLDSDTVTPSKKMIVTPCHHDSDTMSPMGDTMSPSIVTPCHPNNQLNNQLTIIEEIMSEPSVQTQPSTGQELNNKKQRRKENSELLNHAKEVLEFLNRKTKKNFEMVKVNLDLISCRLKEGASVSDCKMVIAARCRIWLNDEKMYEYLRPKTIFARQNFWQYKGELKNDD